MAGRRLDWERANLREKVRKNGSKPHEDMLPRAKNALQVSRAKRPRVVSADAFRERLQADIEGWKKAVALAREELARRVTVNPADSEIAKLRRRILILDRAINPPRPTPIVNSVPPRPKQPKRRKGPRRKFGPNRKTPRRPRANRGKP